MTQDDGPLWPSATDRCATIALPSGGCASVAQPQRQRSLLTFARSSGVIWGEASSCFSMVGKTCPELLGVRTCPP